jgi:quercetin dioxygenase-like cupin family protein
MASSDSSLPTETLVPLESPFVDARGAIQNLVHRSLGSAVLITSEQDSIRAEHWHREDFHYCYLISGSLLYLERPVGSKNLPVVTEITAGQLFFTPPNVEHAMYFTSPSSFLTLGKLSRTHEAYEADLVRLTARLTDIPEIREQCLAASSRHRQA